MMVVPNLVVLMSLVLFLLTLRWANSLSLFLFSCRNCGGFDKLGLFSSEIYGGFEELGPWFGLGFGGFFVN